MNPFDIRVQCINIENSELLFEQCRMALNQHKYNIEVRNDDAIKRNQIIIWFRVTNVQSSGWIIFRWKMYFDIYNNERSIEEAVCSGSWNTEQRKKDKKRKEGSSKPSKKKTVLWIIQPEKFKQQVTHPIKILILTHHNRLK